MSENQKRTRGKGVKPSLVHANVRIPAWVLEFYKEYPSYTGMMRKVLTDYAAQHKEPTEQIEQTEQTPT